MSNEGKKFQYLWNNNLQFHEPTLLYQHQPQNIRLHSTANSDGCLSHGYAGDGYYNMQIWYDLATLENQYNDAMCTRTRGGAPPGGGTNDTIDWNDPAVIDIVGQLQMEDEFTITINGNPPRTPLEEMIVEYFKQVNLKQQMDILCYKAIDLISNSEEYTQSDYITWIGRLNTIESDYWLVDIYMSCGNFAQALTILNAMPAKFSNLDMNAHQNYLSYFSSVQQCYALPDGEVVG